MLNWFRRRYNIIDSDEKLEQWIGIENPYEFFNDEDKNKIKRIGSTLNNCIRNGMNMNEDESFNRFESLIKRKQLKNPLVVYRGQQSIEYERRLAEEQNLGKRYLYYDGFVYTSLNKKSYYYNTRNIKIKIYIPRGINYLYTGKYSNTPESNELVLNIGTTLKIISIIEKGRIVYIEATVEKQI